MSLGLWQQLPKNFLSMNYARWHKLGYDVKGVIIELAKEQTFKCALCYRDRRLVVDHDHDPQEGPGRPYTIYNIRGLVCSKCNWHLMVFEKQENGEHLNWENVDCNLSDQQYEDYNYVYECRIEPLLDELREKRMGRHNYLRRKFTLQNFDDWYYEGGQPPLWYRRYKKEQSRKIETPEDAIRVLTAIFEFIKQQFEKDANYQPPEQFWQLWARLRPIIDEVRASKEQP